MSLLKSWFSHVLPVLGGRGLGFNLQVIALCPVSSWLTVFGDEQHWITSPTHR